MKKRLLSVLLALCMVMTILPIAAFATDETAAPQSDTQIEGGKTDTPTNTDTNEPGKDTGTEGGGSTGTDDKGETGDKTDPPAAGGDTETKAVEATVNVGGKSGETTLAGGIHTYTATAAEKLSLGLVQSGEGPGTNAQKYNYYPSITLPGVADADAGTLYILSRGGKDGYCVSSKNEDDLKAIVDKYNGDLAKDNSDAKKNGRQAYDNDSFKTYHEVIGQTSFAADEVPYWPGIAGNPVVEIVVATPSIEKAATTYTFVKYKFDFSAVQLELPFTVTPVDKAALKSAGIEDSKLPSAEHQSNIAASADPVAASEKSIAVTGSSSYVKFPWFSNKAEDAEGNYVALKLALKDSVADAATEAEATPKFTVTLSDKSTKDLDEDGILVWRLTDTNRKVPVKLSFTDKSANAGSVTYTLDLSAVEAEAKKAGTDLEVVASTTTLPGKTVAQLQKDIKATKPDANKIIKVTGTSNYVANYTGFSSKTDEQRGHYLALQFKVADGADVVVKGSTAKPEVTLDKADYILVTRLEHLPENGLLTVEVTPEGGDTAATYTLDLTGVKLDTAPAPTIVAGPLHDTSNRVPDTQLATGYKAELQADGKTVKVTASNVRLHKNGDTPADYGYWTGVQFKAPEGYVLKYKYPTNAASWVLDVADGSYVSMYDGGPSKTPVQIAIGVFETADKDNTSATPISSETYTLDFSGVTTKQPTATVSYTAYADKTIVSDCVDETMWVTFDEPFHPDTKLWFDITDGTNTVGIGANCTALEDGSLPLKQAWSFTNKDQFEDWANTIADFGNVAGDYTVKGYTITTIPAKGSRPTAAEMKLLFTETVKVTPPVADVTVAKPATPAVDVTAIPSEKQDDVKKAVANVGVPADKAGTLQSAANEVAAQNKETAAYKPEAGLAKLKDELSIPDETQASAVTIVYQPYLEVKATGYSDGATKSLTVDITPMVRILATTETVTDSTVLVTKAEATAPGSSKVQNASELGTKPVTVSDPVVLQIGLPTGFVTKSGESYPNVFIQHEHNGTTYEYEATVKELGTDPNKYLVAEFTNPNGFSTFTVTTETQTVATVGGQNYTTLQGAIDAAKDGDVVTVTKAGTYEATMSAPARTIHLVKADGIGDVKVTINGGEQKPLSATEQTDFTYTPPKTTPSGGGAAVVVERPFDDVAESHWADAAITWAYENRIMVGTADRQFSPTMITGRNQMWMVLARLDGVRPANLDAAREWALSAGVSDGKNPSNPMSREQMVTMLYRFAVKKGLDVSYTQSFDSYPDAASVSTWASDAMRWAVANGIIKGLNDGRLNPTGTATRAEFAEILHRYCQLYKLA